MSAAPNLTCALTDAHRAHLRQLFVLGIIFSFGRRVLDSKLAFLVTGNTYPIRHELKELGFTYRAKTSLDGGMRGGEWSLSAASPIDLDILLPALISAHHAHEQRSESERVAARRRAITDAPPSRATHRGDDGHWHRAVRS